MDRNGAKTYLRKYYAKRLATIIPIVILSLVALFFIVRMIPENAPWNPYMKDKEIISVLDEAYEEYEFLDYFRFNIYNDLEEVICIVRNGDKGIDVGYISMYGYKYSYKKAIESMRSDRNYRVEGELVNCIIDMKLYENKKDIPEDALVMREIKDKKRKLYYCIEDVNVINEYSVNCNHAISEIYGKDNYGIIEVFSLFDDADYLISNMGIIKTSNGSIDIGEFYRYDDCDYSEAFFHILVEDMMVEEYYLVDSCTSSYHVGMALYDNANIPDKTYKVFPYKLHGTTARFNARKYIEVPTDDGVLYFAIDCLKYVPEE